MSNYKDVDAIVKEIEKLPDTYDKKTLKKCLKIINKIPLSDMKPVVHGKWESKKSAYMSDSSLYACSVCNEYYFKHPYCPFCGATMDGE